MEFHQSNSNKNIHCPSSSTAKQQPNTTQNTTTENRQLLILSEENEPNDQIYICPHCKKTFPSEEAFGEHVQNARNSTKEKMKEKRRHARENTERRRRALPLLQGTSNGGVGIGPLAAFHMNNGLGYGPIRRRAGGAFVRNIYRLYGDEINSNPLLSATSELNLFPPREATNVQQVERPLGTHYGAPLLAEAPMPDAFNGEEEYDLTLKL